MIALSSWFLPSITKNLAVQAWWQVPLPDEPSRGGSWWGCGIDRGLAPVYFWLTVRPFIPVEMKGFAVQNSLLPRPSAWRKWRRLL